MAAHADHRRAAVARRRRDVARGCLTTGCALIASLTAGSCVSIQSPDPRVTFVAVGDSSTAGPSSEDFIEFLPELTGETASRFANEGDGGATIEQVADRLSELLDAGLYPNARVVTFWAGGNDLIDFILQRDPLLLFAPDSANYPFAQSLDDRLDRIQADVTDGLNRGREAGMTTLAATYFALPQFSLDCPALLFDVLTENQARHANTYVEMLNARIRLAAISAGADIVDVALLSDTLLADPDNYFNCNHLSAAGNRIVAGAFANALDSSGALVDLETEARR